MVRSVMHCDEELPRVHEETDMTQAVEEMSRKRLGMTCVLDGQDRLTGVLTDGDLRRWMLQVSKPLEGTAANAMTSAPLTIAPEALATEALKLMEERKITSLPVVEDDRSLVGVVQIHDLWRTELF